jgi:hypothetical protein
MKRLFRSVNNRVAGAVAVTGLLLIPLGVFGGSAFGHSGAAQYKYKVTICHHTGSKKHPWHQITISNKAVAAHLRHGDSLLLPCPTTATVAKHHGKPSSDTSHGQSSTGTQGHESSTQGHENNQGGNGNGKDDSNGHHGKP